MRTKTTLELEEPVYRKLKSLAGKEGKTLKRLMDEIIVLGLKQKETSKKKPAFRWPGSSVLVPKFDLSDKEKIQSIIDREDYYVHN